MPALKVIIFILFLILIASFAVKNMNPVEVIYYDYKLQSRTLELPLMVIILAPFGLGFIAAWLIGAYTRMKLRSTVRKQNKTIRSLEEEIEHLKPESPVSSHTPGITAND